MVTGCLLQCVIVTCRPNREESPVGPRSRLGVRNKGDRGITAGVKVGAGLGARPRADGSLFPTWPWGCNSVVWLLLWLPNPRKGV
jgi:hypothetical protein